MAIFEPKKNVGEEIAIGQSTLLGIGNHREETK
jgi:hypothetical protein